VTSAATRQARCKNFRVEAGETSAQSMSSSGGPEPFQRLMNQGQVINEGRAMSKSLGNGVDLGKQIDEFGVDAGPRHCPATSTLPGLH
jgi:valyl-tRNA synthetase